MSQESSNVVVPEPLPLSLQSHEEQRRAENVILTHQAFVNAGIGRSDLSEDSSETSASS